MGIRGIRTEVCRGITILPWALAFQEERAMLRKEWAWAWGTIPGPEAGGFRLHRLCRGLRVAGAGMRVYTPGLGCAERGKAR
jgi:hypothetical protein